MPDLRLLVVGKDQVLVDPGAKPCLHVSQVEGILVEHPTQEAQFRCVREILVRAQPMNVAGGRKLAPVGVQLYDLHDAMVALVYVRAEAIDDPVVRAPGMEIWEERVVKRIE